MRTSNAGVVWGKGGQVGEEADIGKTRNFTALLK